MVSNDARREVTLGAVTVLVLAVGGLAVVKWIPYYNKALLAFTHHSMGNSILTGGADRSPNIWCWCWRWARRALGSSRTWGTRSTILCCGY
jgi:hypothetical protein